ncbi:hypothetical protein IMY05_007G0013900 [Salix suchowensis]|nr:hypothetical protein IMY05_007G0013900 [Salix suchowensis]
MGEAWGHVHKLQTIMLVSMLEPEKNTLVWLFPDINWPACLALSLHVQIYGYLFHFPGGWLRVKDGSIKQIDCPRICIVFPVCFWVSIPY